MQNQQTSHEELENEKLHQPDSLWSDENDQSNWDQQQSEEQQEFQQNDFFQKPEILDWFPEPEQWEVQNIQEFSPHTLKKNDDDSIKKEDIEAIQRHGMDAKWLYWYIKEWIESAVVQWPKWEILPDWKARANLINAFMKATGRFKSDNVINILNLFGKVNTENNKDIY